MLNLNIELPVAKKSNVSYEDVLSSQLEFEDIYQSFIDYKNVCEVVLKAKASEKSIGFAEELLGTSLDNVSVSKEEFLNKKNAMFDAFIQSWNIFSDWAVEALDNIIDKINLIESQEGTGNKGIRGQSGSDRTRRYGAVGYKDTPQSNHLQSNELVVPFKKTHLQELANALRDINEQGLTEHNFQNLKHAIDTLSETGRYYTAVFDKSPNSDGSKWCGTAKFCITFISKVLPKIKSVELFKKLNGIKSKLSRFISDLNKSLSADNPAKQANRTNMSQAIAAAVAKNMINKNK